MVSLHKPFIICSFYVFCIFCIFVCILWILLSPESLCDEPEEITFLSTVLFNISLYSDKDHILIDAKDVLKDSPVSNWTVPSDISGQFRISLVIEETCVLWLINHFQFNIEGASKSVVYIDNKRIEIPVSWLHILGLIFLWIYSGMYWLGFWGFLVFTSSVILSTWFLCYLHADQKVLLHCEAEHLYSYIPMQHYSI